MSSKKNLVLIKIYLLRNRIKIFLKLIRAKVKLEKKVRQSLLRLETVRTIETFIPVYIQNKAKFKRRTSHVLNLMQMSKILCSSSFTLDLAHEKFDV